MSKTQEERETIIRFDDSSDLANIYTASPSQMRKWVKKGYPMKVKSTFQGEETGWETQVPKKLFKGSKLNSTKRPTKEVSQKAIQALRDYRSSKKSTLTQSDPTLTPPDPS